MRRIPVILSLMALMLMPVYASAQTPDRIAILDNLGEFENGEPLFVFGKIAAVSDDSFLIMQIINPRGDLCQIQQLIPLSDGAFITDAIPLAGAICGISGQYEVKLFYGENSKSATFTVSSDVYSPADSDQRIELAQQLVSDHADAISDIFEVSPPDTNSSDLDTLESAYVEMWVEFFDEDLLFETSPAIRLALSSALDSVATLLGSGEISSDVADSIDRTIFSSIFHYEIGDHITAIGMLADTFVEIRNVDPEKSPDRRAPTFDELEETLLNLMKKQNTVMSKLVKSEIAFIFSRGTAPLYTDEIADLIDVLSKSRYLDVISRNQADLYRLVQKDWDSLKPSMQEKESIEDLLESKERVTNLHTAAILLRELDGVERFISSDSDDELANLLRPDWNKLEKDLTLASSVDDILEAEAEIRQMAQVIDISSRISKSVEISRSTGVDSGPISDWESLLERVDQADSIDEILEIISEFDQSITDLREKRNPLDILELQYTAMKQKAELQADYSNLYLIDNALKILATARDMESGNPSITRIDRIEVLLTWASEKAPQIEADLNSYNKDAFKIKAADILQRAKSLEDLVELSNTKNRFLPNYGNFTAELNEEIDRVRDLVIQNDLDRADLLIRDLFDEWQLVSDAYAKDPRGSDVGYTSDELKRIELRKLLDGFASMVSTFYNVEFTAHADEYSEMLDDAYDLIAISNFIDAESKITEIANFIGTHLTLSSPSIIYDISFDPETETWVISGATEKSSFDRRDDLHFIIYNMDGTIHDSLEFTDTRQGNFYTQWIAPTDPGLYVVSLQYKEFKATQIVHIEKKFESVYDEVDLNMAELARQFDDLKSFAERFGGDAFDSNPRFDSVINEIKVSLTSKNTSSVNENLEELKTLIERYLPVRSRSAVIEALYDGERLVLSGAVQKALPFSEDLLIDIYDQRGNRIEELIIKDTASGLFAESVSRSFDSGIYVVQLEHHEVTVTDFFSVR